MAEELEKISMRTKAVDGLVQVDLGQAVNQLHFTPQQALTWAKLLWNEAYVAQQQSGKPATELGEQPIWGKQVIDAKEN